MSENILFSGKDFFPAACRTITKEISGKTVEKVIAISARMDDLLIVQFTDGTEFVIRYDWIYEWGVRETDEQN